MGLLSDQGNFTRNGRKIGMYPRECGNCRELCINGIDSQWVCIRSTRDGIHCWAKRTTTTCSFLEEGRIEPGLFRFLRASGVANLGRDGALEWLGVVVPCVVPRDRPPTPLCEPGPGTCSPRPRGDRGTVGECRAPRMPYNYTNKAQCYVSHQVCHQRKIRKGSCYAVSPKRRMDSPIAVKTICGKGTNEREREREREI